MLSSLGLEGKTSLYRKIFFVQRVLRGSSKRERIRVSCSEDHNINVFFHCPVSFKDSRGFCKLLHAGFNSDCPTEDTGWQLIIHNLFWFFPLTQRRKLFLTVAIFMRHSANDLFSQFKNNYLPSQGSKSTNV